MKRKYRIVLAAGMLCAALIMMVNCSRPVKKYEAEWASLQTHPVPEWFQDAKFGIYTHWGVYAVPSYENEWYPRLMYSPENRRNIYEHHRETYGEPWDFGYSQFVPMFTAEKFDAGEWADLFKEAGAQFAGPVAEHHDGFAMWDCGFSEWDAKDKGPKRDIVGELAREIRKRDMHFVTSFHHAFNWKYFEPSYTLDKRCDTQDPVFAGVNGLFPEPHEPGAVQSEAFLRDWLAKVKEVIDNYHPDYLWFDFGWREEAFDPYKRELLAYYYNQAAKRKQGVVVTYKDDHLPKGAGVLDLERGKIDTLTDFVWITDTSIEYKSWSYIDAPLYKDVNTLVDNLIDRVSKNGRLLLNIGPRPDGSIPEEQQALLRAIGKWLKVNGEAIYGTRPWVIYGEGPVQTGGGMFSEKRGQKAYTAEDIRFTTQEGIIYAILMDWPQQNKVVIKSLHAAAVPEGRISAVHLLGNPNKLSWKQDEDGLTVILPEGKPCDHAYALKITLK